MNFDVIVAGGGPGGSTAAYELARQGVRVALFDKARFPREKPCGGCLSLKIDHILEPDFHDVVERTVYGATFSFRGTDEFHVRSDLPIAYMVMRRRFDAFLLEKARKVGAEIHEAEPVLDVVEDSTGIRVRTPRGEFRARYLVGADGATGIVARCLGIAAQRRVAACVEAETIPGGPVRSGHDEVHMEMGSVPFGYGWVFPKGDHLSVGVGGLKGKAGNPRTYYEDFLVDQDLLESVTEEGRRGYIIPVFANPAAPISSGRTLLVGDAASLVDPFIAEGVYYAVRSAQLAAEVLRAVLTGAADGLSAYRDRVDEEIFSEFRSARNVAFFVYAFPEMGYRILKRRPSFAALYFDVLRGDAGYADLWREQRRTGVLDVLRAVWPAGRKPGDVAGHYDRIAPRYDSMLRLWRTVVAEPAWDALRELVGRHVRKGSRVLDAGTGTGEAVSLILESSNAAAIAGADFSKGMLRVARHKIDDPRVEWKRADITRLPYPDRAFDVVVSTWTLETMPDPRAAVAEFLRLIKDDGFVIYAFSSRPSGGLPRLYARLLDEWASGTLRGRFMVSSETPFHDCEHSQLSTYARGLATIVVLRKCCRVEGSDAPCLPGVAPTAS